MPGAYALSGLDERGESSLESLLAGLRQIDVVRGPLSVDVSVPPSSMMVWSKSSMRSTRPQCREGPITRGNAHLRPGVLEGTRGSLSSLSTRMRCKPRLCSTRHLLELASEYRN